MTEFYQGYNTESDQADKIGTTLIHPMLLLTTREVHTGNIRTAVLMYGPNEVRSVRKTKVRIFSRMDRPNWSIRYLLCRHNQH